MSGAGMPWNFILSNASMIRGSLASGSAITGIIIVVVKKRVVVVVLVEVGLVEVMEVPRVTPRLVDVIRVFFTSFCLEPPFEEFSVCVERSFFCSAGFLINRVNIIVWVIEVVVAGSVEQSTVVTVVVVVVVVSVVVLVVVVVVVVVVVGGRGNSARE